MKNNAIIRIIAYSIVIVILIGLLFVGMGSFPFLSRKQNDSHGTAATLNSGSGSIDAESVKTIEVEWIDGNIEIEKTDGTEIRYSESNVKNAKDAMVVSVNGDCLRIQFSENMKDMKGISLGSHSKDLNVQIPEKWNGKEIVIESVSAEINASGLKADRFEIETVSGGGSFTNCSFQKVSLETVSGTIRYQGELETLDCSGVSAACTIDLQNCPKDISMETVSGNLSIALPENCGFTAKTETVSGKISSDFLTTQNGKTYTYGDGSCKINVSGISGDIHIAASAQHK